MNKDKKSAVSKKGSITDDMEKLKQRREDRKQKNFGGNNDNKGGNVPQEFKACDADYEKLMKKKKIEFDQEPNQVIAKIYLAYF